MPDPSLIHGRALPAPELPAGTVTVRVVREAIGNNIAGQDVRLTVGGRRATATTDDAGPRRVHGPAAGAEVRAEATVERRSAGVRPFTVPASGGLRVILVAGIRRRPRGAEQEAAAAAAAPPVQGRCRARPQHPRR